MINKDLNKPKEINKITFQVEDIERATEVLKEIPIEDIVNKYSQKIETFKAHHNNLVEFGTHSFLQGMYKAYSDHRPFILSPDMIWLLICQGFSKHTNANKETLRNKLINFKGTSQLVIYSQDIKVGNPNSQWQNIFPEFKRLMEDYVDKDLLKIISSNFSTTTSIEKIVTDITILDTFKPYFEYVILYAICGIPEITIEGSSNDWLRIIEKTKKLNEYEISWWTKELIPILEKFKDTSEGNIDRDFWRNMFKIHTLEDYGKPKLIDGWIIKFYPYDKDGNKRNLNRMTISEIKTLPDEIVSIDFVVKETNTHSEVVKEYPLEFNGGFIGLYQNKLDLSLRPEIGWFISHQTENKAKFDQEYFDSIVYKNLEEFPNEILTQTEIRKVDLRFNGNVLIPEQIKNVEIDVLRINGSINEEEINKLINLLPNTFLIVNDEYLGKNKN